MIKRFAIVALCLGLMACGRSTSAIQEAVRGRLLDPSSAQFGPIVYSRDGNRACVGVNSKNRMGGYTGQQEVQVERSASTGGWSVVAIPAPGCTESMRSGEEADQILTDVNQIMEKAEADDRALNATR